MGRKILWGMLIAAALIVGAGGENWGQDSMLWPNGESSSFLNYYNWEQSQIGLLDHYQAPTTPFKLSKAMADSNITLVKRMYHGPGRVVCVHDNYAYVGADAALLVFDVFNPDEPVLKGCTYTLSNIGDLKAKGNMLYVRHPMLRTSLYPYEALEIFDISDPINPAKVGSFRAVWLIKFSVDESGKYVYTIYKKTFDQPFTFGILDVSDPTNPQIIGNYVSTNGSIMDHFCVGSHAYVTQHISKYENNVLITKDTLQVLDISNPSNPTLVGAYGGADSLKAMKSFVVVDTNYVYLGTGDPRSPNTDSLKILDFSNPSSPVELGSVQISMHMSLFMADSLVYFISFSGDSLLLGVIDVTDPAAPTKIGPNKWPLPEGMYYSLDPFISHDLIYFPGLYLMIIDISDLDNIKERGSCYIEDFIHDVNVYGNYAYVAQGMDGVRILDVSDPTNPQEIGSYQNGTEITKVIASDKYIFLPTYQSPFSRTIREFTIIDVSDPTSPKKVGLFDCRDYKAKRIFAVGDTLYLSLGWEGLGVYYISDSDTIVEITKYCTENYVHDVWISGNLAYLLDAGGGVEGGTVFNLHIIDLSDLSNIEELGSCEISRLLEGSLVVSESKAYLPILPRESASGFIIVDLSDPYNPQEITFFNVASADPPQIGVWQNYVFWTVGRWFDKTILAIDTSEPTDIKVVGNFDLQENSIGWANLQDVERNFIYLTGEFFNNGLFILKFTPPTGVVELSPGSDVPDRFSLQQNYPNPFNLNTIIRYSLPGSVKSHVSLKIYNLLGQEVQTLVDELQMPGYYSVRWDGKDKQGKDVASGIYLYQLKAGDFVEMKKMTVLR